MGFEEQLNELLAGLGVELGPADELGTNTEDSLLEERYDTQEQEHARTGKARHQAEQTAPGELLAYLAIAPDMSLFQASREHYGVYYRLDLMDDMPQLRIFIPDDTGPVKMRCYAICPASASPLRAWFTTTGAHSGSDAYDDTLDATRQHLLFAAGELMKRLFWSGDMESMRFPSEIEVLRLM
jgi:hypothetical protein